MIEADRNRSSDLALFRREVDNRTAGTATNGQTASHLPVTRRLRPCLMTECVRDRHLEHVTQNLLLLIGVVNADRSAAHFHAVHHQIDVLTTNLIR